jgi:hypothetical protein
MLGALLKEVVRSRLQSGALPRGSKTAVFDQRGGGRMCACCDEKITEANIQLYGIDIRPKMGEVRGLLMHLRCYELWLNEADVMNSAVPGTVAGSDTQPS